MFVFEEVWGGEWLSDRDRKVLQVIDGAHSIHYDPCIHSATASYTNTIFSRFKRTFLKISFVLLS